MTSPNQTAIVEDQVNDALANGARALTGGKKVEGPATTSSRPCWSTSTTR